MNKNLQNEYPKMPEGFYMTVKNTVNSLGENNEINIKRKSPFRIGVLVAAIIAVFTVTVFGADEVYNYFVKMDNHKVTIELNEEDSVINDAPEYVRLEFGYMPKNINPYDAPYKFNVITESGEDAPSGLTFQLFKAEKAKELEIYCVGSVTQCMFGENMGAVLNIDSGVESDGDSHDKEFLIYFKDFGYILRCYVSERINKDEMMKIAENISLVESDKENAFIIDTYIPTIDNGGIIVPDEDMTCYTADAIFSQFIESCSDINR